MDILTAIHTRRSVRRFTSDPVSEADLEVLLRAAMQAPSADNGQPWHFIVINDREIMNTIPSIHPWSEMMKEAALGILVCGRIVEGEMGGYWQQDCAAATENIGSRPRSFTMVMAVMVAAAPASMQVPMISKGSLQPADLRTASSVVGSSAKPAVL